MDQEFDNTNRGALFVNDRKTTERHPDYTGKVNVEGVEYWISAWVKQTRAGEILSLSVGERVDKSGPAKARTLGATPVRAEALPRSGTDAYAPSGKTPSIDDMDEDIPF